MTTIDNFSTAHGAPVLYGDFLRVDLTDREAVREVLSLGERQEPESRPIPIVIQAASGRRPHLKVFGDDYDTPDVTCIRDYIHVEDLSEAQGLAMQRLLKGGASQAFNLGSGGGFSVRQVIDGVEAVTGVRVPIETGQRREGNPARLDADSMLAREQVGWQPAYPGLESIVRHAWNWERRS